MSQSAPTPAYVHLTVREFSVGSDEGQDCPTSFIDSDGLLLKLASHAHVPRPENTSAAVAVLLGVDSNHHQVHIDSLPRERFEMLTEAAAAILRVRDCLLTMHGHADYEAYAAAGRRR